MYIIHKLCPPTSTSRYISQYITLCISVRHALYLSAARSIYLSAAHFIYQYVTLYILVRHAVYLSKSRYISQHVMLRISAHHDVSLRSVAGLEE